MSGPWLWAHATGATPEAVVVVSQPIGFSARLDHPLVAQGFSATFSCARLDATRCGGLPAKPQGHAEHRLS